jgi:hypothetical protein
MNVASKGLITKERDLEGWVGRKKIDFGRKGSFGYLWASQRKHWARLWGWGVLVNKKVYALGQVIEVHNLDYQGVRQITLYLIHCSSLVFPTRGCTHSFYFILISHNEPFCWPIINIFGTWATSQHKSMLGHASLCPSATPSFRSSIGGKLNHGQKI